jgi:hypothetical protein
MASQRPMIPTPFSFRLRLPKVIRELERATEEVLHETWDQGNRERVSEIASTLSEAFRLVGLRGAAAMARSIASLMKVSPEQIRPVEAAFREKITELLTSLKETAEELLTDTGRRTGGG